MDLSIACHLCSVLNWYDAIYCIGIVAKLCGHPGNLAANPIRINRSTPDLKEIANGLDKVLYSTGRTARPFWTE